MVTLPVLIRRFAPYLKPVRSLVAISVLLMLIEPLIGVSFLAAVKTLVDEVFIGRNFDLLPAVLGGYLGLIVCKLVLDHVLTRVDVAITERITLDVRTDLYANAISLSPGSPGRKAVGDTLSHLSSDVERPEHLVYSGPLGVLSNVTTAVFYAVFLCFLSWKLTLCALLVAPCLAFTSLHVSSRVRRLSRAVRHRRTAWMSLAEERLGASDMLQAFGAERDETTRFRDRCRAAMRLDLKVVALQARLSSVVEVVGAVGALLVLTVGALEIRSGALSVGALIAFVGSVGSLQGPIKNLAKAWTRFQRSAAAAERVVDLLDAVSLVAESPNARPLPSVRGRLEFRDVRFSYGRGPEVLKGIDLRIEPGETVAIVGASGAGKSTLSRLALRFYDPSAGSVSIDGHDLRDATLESVRRAITVVFQEPFILRGSAAENIRYGRQDASAAEVEAMAAAAHAHHFLTPSGAEYGSAVGPRGGRLSGGQRQRLALARAFLRRAPIMILDEATASVDSETEELIQDAVERLAGDRTLIIIGHRLSSVTRADRIVVLEGGRIVESGTPETLFSGETRCRELFAAQLASPRRAA